MTLAIVLAGGWATVAAAAAFLANEGFGTPWPRALLGALTWPTWPLAIAGSWLRYRLKRRSRCSSGS